MRKRIGRKGQTERGKRRERGREREREVERGPEEWREGPERGSLDNCS